MRLPRFILRRLLALRDKTVAARDPDFLIGGSERPYMRRWYVIPRNRAFNIYLHQFLRSDDDRALHDHPWLNLSILLDGAYVEHSIKAGGVNARAYRSAGDFKFRRARNAHRVELITPPAIFNGVAKEDPCWTLFITGPVLREWGFHCPHGWRHWKEFVDQRDTGAVGRGCDT